MALEGYWDKTNVTPRCFPVAGISQKRHEKTAAEPSESDGFGQTELWVIPSVVFSYYMYLNPPDSATLASISAGFAGGTDW